MTPKKCNKLLQRIFQTENISCDLKTRNRENLLEKSVKKKKKIFWFFSRLFLLPTVISVGVVCAIQKVKPVWQLESETGCVCCWKMNMSKTTPGSDSRKQKNPKITETWDEEFWTGLLDSRFLCVTPDFLFAFYWFLMKSWCTGKSFLPV